MKSTRSQKCWMAKKTKTRPKRGFVWNDTYGKGFYLLFAPTQEQLTQEWEKFVNYFYPGYKLDKDFDTALSAGRALFYKDLACIAFKDSKPDPKIIAHEALHFVNETFSDIGYRPALTNDEAQAYFLQWVVGRITEESK